jgi:hypothetical protein
LIVCCHKDDLLSDKMIFKIDPVQNKFSVNKDVLMQFRRVRG